jgi:hypothetical protein
VKTTLIVEAEGGPLGITVAGANVPDEQLLAETIEAIDSRVRCGPIVCDMYDSWVDESSRE